MIHLSKMDVQCVNVAIIDVLHTESRIIRQSVKLFLEKYYIIDNFCRTLTAR